MGETKKVEKEEEMAKENGEKPKAAAEEEKPKPAEVVKKEEGEKKEGDGAAANPPPPPPPPEEVVMRVYMHCEGCARKVRRSLNGFQGVEEVLTDCRAQRVVVKGRKAAEDPLRVVERVQRKSGRKVELLSPIPPPPKTEKREEFLKKAEEKPKPQEKKEEQVVEMVLKVHMHCEACAQEMKKRILKMKGVESADPELKTSQVTVRGAVDADKLVEYVYKRTGKHAVIVKSEPINKKPEEDKPAGKDEKGSDAGAKEKETKEESGGGEGNKDGGVTAGDESGGAAAKLVEMKKNELYYYYPRHHVEYAYPPQIFSDENPNACAVM